MISLILIAIPFSVGQVSSIYKLSKIQKDRMHLVAIPFSVGQVSSGEDYGIKNQTFRQVAIPFSVGQVSSNRRCVMGKTHNAIRRNPFFCRAGFIFFKDKVVFGIHKTCRNPFFYRAGFIMYLVGSKELKGKQRSQSLFL